VSDVILEVDELRCVLPTPDGDVALVDGASFTLERGEALGVAGESGSGKTMLVRTLMGIGPSRAVVSGRVVLDGADLLTMPKRERRHRLGRSIGIVFQNPMTALNPVVPIGRQITEGMRLHHSLRRAEAQRRAAELLALVGISEPAKRLHQYPHQLSGGMQQRVGIAAALACEPDVLIADEATTALDVTIQKQILDLLTRLQRERSLSMIVISHDLGVIAGRTDRLAVMYGGQFVEQGPTTTVFERRRHRYTAALLDADPRHAQEPHSRLRAIPGLPPHPSEADTGCRFAPRCAHATDECRNGPVALQPDERDPRHLFRCVWPVDAPEPTDSPAFTSAHV
jgi:peptide/nickel transport system ATP-binding protein